MNRIEWVDGLRGFCCLVVMLGHSVACIVPSVFFGNAFASHSKIELMIHNSPLMLCFNSSTMVGIFLFLSGWCIGKKSYTDKFLKRLFLKYKKYLPMTLVSVLISYLVMVANAVYSLELADYSHARTYVEEYNNFKPVVSNAVFDGAIRVFVSGTKYNNTLWFISVVFLGGLILEELTKFIKNPRLKCVVLILLYEILPKMEKFDWRMSFLGVLCLGCLVSLVPIEIISVPEWLSWGLFLLGVYVIACPVDYAGIFILVKYLNKLSIVLPGYGLVLLFIGLAKNKTIQRFFECEYLQKAGQYSFAIYVFHWPIVISVSCGMTLFIQKYMNYCIAAFGGISTGCICTILISILYTKHIYKPILEKLKG